MRYYPLFADLSRKRCLVVGAGEVGQRKIGALASCGASEILVLDTREPDASMGEVLALPGVSFEQRSFKDEDLDGRFLVIASTSDEELNWRISRACEARGILCNIVDQPEKCSFIVPALFTQGDLTVAISTGGASPALARKIRKGLGEFLGTEYGAALLLMSRLRPLVLELGLGSPRNGAIFRGLVDSGLLEALEARDQATAADLLERHIPTQLAPRIPELLDGLC
ncbi:Siroheme synthase [Fundidesulfovibrio magnetotacticus]|uniref:precorrin-2 dehydrogenase n=1 Tax=Fundidesulfovibrio magnetotacticus TaxID=2730080 RepID=A0A6V8LNR2_9BACT|nr:bifunctional precorrin-2 dehydrogenase/sirohydrochlorin ferrochelatase [Fundidesulfovibrio magnetotacticus]GFK94243.1 Siroheme synthase [Fundidesulfovibrio magnetotacticus]